MSIETEIKKLTDAVLGLTAVISASHAQSPSAPPAPAPSAASPAAAAATVAPTASQSAAPVAGTAPTTAVAATAAPAPAQSDPPKTPKGVTLLQHAKDLTLKVSGTTPEQREVAVKLLARYGAAKTSEIPEVRLAEFVREAEAILAQQALAA